MPYAWCGANAPATATQDAAGSKPRQNDAAALLERAEAHVNLGIALADSTDLSGALSEFSEAVRLAPSNGTAHYNRGRVLGEMNRDTKAKTELERAASLLSNNADTWSALGAEQRKTGDKSAAVGSLRRAAELEPKDAKRRSVLGRLCKSPGMLKELSRNGERF